MGLDAFRTESSTKSKSSNSSSSSKKNSSSSKSSSSETESTEPETKDRDIMPWFTAVWDKKAEEIKTYEGRDAFLRRKTPTHQEFLANIPDKFDYQRIKSQFKHLKQCTIEEFLEKDQEYAVDMIQRLKTDKLEEHKVDCAVCGEELLVIGDDYLEFQDEYVHPEHNIEKVERQMGVDP